MRAIPVSYTEKILADSGSYSPSAAKPKFVVEALRRAALPIDWRTVTPLIRSMPGLDPKRAVVSGSFRECPACCVRA